MQNNPTYTIFEFLNSIGIQVIERELPTDTFLPGIDILGSTILVDSSQLKYPGDLLHEAGHIAVTEAHLRPLIGSSEMAENWPTDGDELGAILWSYAACKHLSLDLEVVFHPNGYKNDSEWLIEQFRNQKYIGLPLLVWMELCENKEFPNMKKWLR
tara:strand:+ start:292 stop:759 length:468 start_codon:yes stop_codon:yes gene_type:complete